MTYESWLTARSAVSDWWHSTLTVVVAVGMLVIALIHDGIEAAKERGRG